MKSHNLSREDLSFFSATFVQCRFPYNIKMDENSGWLMRIFYGKRAALDDYAIVRHLMGKHLVATFPGPYTKYLCLDLDYSIDLKETLDAILRIFPKSLVTQSSMSEGIHVYHFFESKISVNKLQKLINKILDSRGIVVQPGYCEIFPQINRALRLPLGKGSYVLDEETLSPLHQNVGEGIKLIKEKITYHSITEILSHSKAGSKLTPSIPPLYEAVRNIATLSNGINDSMTTSNSRIPNHPWDKLRGREFKDLIDQSLRSGIEETGTRYFLQSKLIFYYWSLNYSKEQCYDLILKWYLSHDHQSKDWKNNPDRVLRNLKSAIECLYRNAQPKGHYPHPKHKKHLRVADVRNIVQMTPDYRRQKFIFSLLAYALNTKDLIAEFRLPKKTIIKFDACSNTSYQEKISFCESIGLITKIKEHSREDHRARTYRLNYEFLDDEEVVETLEDGLKKIFKLRDLRKMYSGHYFHLITKDGT